MARKIPQQHTKATSPRKPRVKSETTVSDTDRPDHVARPSVSQLDKPSANSDTPKKKADSVYFSDVIADRVVEAIEQLHTIEGVSNALNIPRKTIYDWIKRYPDFKERIETAQRTYYRSVDSKNIANMRSKLAEICEKGWVVKRTTSKEVVDKNGDKIELVTKELTVAPPPDWAFQRVLGGNDETQAIKTLVTAGWIPDELAIEIMEKIDSANGDVKSLFRKRFNLEDL